MEKLMRANFLSTSFNFTSRKRQKYRERKRGNKNSLSPPSQESHFLENSHGENPLISLNREKFHHPRPFHATRSYLEEGKKKKKRGRVVVISSCSKLKSPSPLERGSVKNDRLFVPLSLLCIGFLARKF